MPNNEWAHTKVFYCELLIHVIETSGPPLSGQRCGSRMERFDLGFPSRRTVFYYGKPIASAFNPSETWARSNNVRTLDMSETPEPAETTKERPNPIRIAPLLASVEMS